MSLNVRFHGGQMLIQGPQLTAPECHLRLSCRCFSPRSAGRWSAFSVRRQLPAHRDGNTAAW